VFLVQQGRVERRFFICDKSGTGAYRTFFEVLKLFQASPPSAVQRIFFENFSAARNRQQTEKKCPYEKAVNIFSILA
jgi:hypothetical protein